MFTSTAHLTCADLTEAVLADADMHGVAISVPLLIDSLPLVPTLHRSARQRGTTMGPLVTTDWLVAELGKR